MFENLDDPAPANPGPLDTVIARGGRIRRHRRMAAGAVVMFVVAGGITTATALEASGHNRVVVESPTSTTGDSSTTTSPPASTVPETTIPAATSTTVALPVITTTTQPPHDPHDLSAVSITWPANTYGDFGNCLGVQPVCHNVLTVTTGVPVPVTYTVTNNGGWPVAFNACAAHVADVWADNKAGGYGQFDQVWPAPYPERGAGEATEPCVKAGTILNPGGSAQVTETILAGYRDSAGNVMPSSPGGTAFTPSFLPQCAQPCETLQPNSLVLKVDPSLVPPLAFVIDVKTKTPTAASGQSTQVEITYTNPLAFAVRTPIFGPCWTVKSGTATVDCSGRLPALVIGPNQTVELVATVWARAGFRATGTPLAPGLYAINLGDEYGTDSPPIGGTPVFIVK
jgi:hypothetical protein